MSAAASAARVRRDAPTVSFDASKSEPEPASFRSFAYLILRRVGERRLAMSPLPKILQHKSSSENDMSCVLHA
jgi:hypothetical protein